ncbi:XrtA/PEP-CTERM system-associated ATPase [Sphingorhabdus arenilitoris]|uniref:XrtA/PEP-CTERM system-associated ATPase n=1 Tax=Sphingorhabdus arenilitoris TaxID=1490041 RepID=A0ABV8REM7_9SPHN
MYDQFYGLNGRPFQLTPDPQYYFESGTHRKALSYLGYGLAQGEGFIVITGEVGAGKSTLVAHLMQSIDKSRLSAATIVTSHLDGKDMVQMAAESFGISSHGKDKAEMLKAIESYLHGEARSGRRCLLVVDEAQNLSIDAVEELRMLSNFQLGSQALLQIFLLGQPEFRDLVQNSDALEQLRQRIIATHHLDAMEADEVEPYIIHRLTRAGWNGNPQFGSDAFTALYAETGGVPRKLNMLMSRVMLMGAVEQLHHIDGALVKAVVADMAGKPFEYTAPPSAKAPAAPVVPEAQIAPEPETETEPLPAYTAEAAEELVLDNAAPAQPDGQAETRLADNEDEDVAAVAALEANPELIARLATLEQRVSEQEDALRHVLSMMIDWMDRETSLESKLRQANRAA